MKFRIRWTGYSFRAFIRDIPWRDGLGSLPAGSCASELAEWIQIGIDEYIPHRRYQLKPHSAPWFSSDCAAALADRNRLFNLYRSNECCDTKQAFQFSRNKCKKVFNKAKKRYQKSVKSRVAKQKFGSRDFWKIINSVLNRGKSAIPPLINGAQIIHSSKDKAELFARIFSSNCTQSPTCINFSDSTEPISKKISDLQITPSSVCRAISNLDSSIASGPDSIPAIIFKKCGPELSSILSKLFNKCLSESSFPECWKCANIVPAFKNCGDRSDPSKYRPISLLPIVSKIFETLINKKLTDHLESLGLLTDKQYGFRKNRSTADLLTVITVL